jgi:hypothetical protein
MTGAKFLMEDNPNYYQHLKSKNINLDTKSVRQIEKDIGRTFPNEKEFSRLELKEVLVAYSIRNPNVGYCQGLNFIVAILLMFGFTEEETFWIYVQIIEKYLPYDYFSSMAGILLDQKVFDCLFRLKMVNVSKHLDRLGIESCILTVQWFICLFSFTFNRNIVMCLWDMIFSHGHSILFQIGLGTIWVLRKKILGNKDFVSLLETFENSCKEINDFEELKNAINKRKFRIKPAILAQLNAAFRGEVEDEFKERFSANPNTRSVLGTLQQECFDDDDCKQKIYLTGGYFSFIKSDVHVIDDFITQGQYTKVVDASYLREMQESHLIGRKNHLCSGEHSDEELDAVQFMRRNTAQSVRRSISVISSHLDFGELES